MVQKIEDIERLVHLIENNEDWLLDTIVDYAREFGYLQYTATLKEAWRLAVVGLSAALSEGLKKLFPDYALKAGENYTHDSISSFAAIQAQRHRARGVTLDMFFGLMKYFREGYCDLVRQKNTDLAHSEYFISVIHRLFDRIETAFCLEWASLSHNHRTKELQSLNRTCTEEKLKYLTIFESHPLPVLVLNIKNQIENMNFAAKDLVAGSGITGEHYYKIFKGKAYQVAENIENAEFDLPELVAFDMLFPWITEDLKSFVNSKENSMSMEKEVKEKGHSQFFNIDFSKIVDISEKFTGIIVMLEDITKNKKAEEILRKAKDDAQRAAQSKSDFLANMSHEIRTPMNAIIGMSHLALKTELTSQQYDYVKKIDISANSLLGIINDILDFSKIEADKMNIEEITFSLNETLSNVANMIMVKSQEKERLKVLFHIDPKIPQFLIGDPRRLSQVIINLGNNAVKFTEKGEIILKAELTEQSKTHATIRFSVRDTGIGMSETQLARLFTAFSQADSSISRKYGGTGLGLTISKRLVDMMHGEIWAKSEPGLGSEFMFTAKFGIGQSLVSANSKILADDLKHLKVLVIDDNKTARQILIELLTTINFTADQASSGEKGLMLVKQAAETQPFDLIFIDWQMPGMDGIETSKKILKMIHPKKVPRIILVTAYAEEVPREAVKELGLHGFLAKPVSPSTLINSIMQAYGNLESHTLAATKDFETEMTKPIQGAHILLVEDNEINQQVAREILENAGLLVTIAENGQIAVDQVYKHTYDAVLMDVQMPVMDGYESTRVIRKEAKYNALPIIAMSASAMIQDKEMAKKSGMNDHVSKPLNVKELLSILRKWIVHKERPFSECTTQSKKSVQETNNMIIPELPGIDVEEGLSRVSGKKNIYIKMLNNFVCSFPESAQEIQTLLNDEDFATARQIAQTIKRVSSSIGAKSLQKITGELELAIQSNEKCKFDNLIKSFKKEMEGVLNVLRPVLNEIEKSNVIENKIEIGDTQTLLNFLSELKPHVKKRKPKFCKRIIKKMGQFEWPEDIAKDVSSIIQLIQKYKYKKAMPVLQSLIQRIS